MTRLNTQLWVIGKSVSTPTTDTDVEDVNPYHPALWDRWAAEYGGDPPDNLEVYNGGVTAHAYAGTGLTAPGANWEVDYSNGPLEYHARSAGLLKTAPPTDDVTPWVVSTRIKLWIREGTGFGATHTGGYGNVHLAVGRPWGNHTVGVVIGLSAGVSGFPLTVQVIEYTTPSIDSLRYSSSFGNVLATIIDHVDVTQHPEMFPYYLTVELRSAPGERSVTVNGADYTVNVPGMLPGVGYYVGAWSTSSGIVQVDTDILNIVRGGS